MKEKFYPWKRFWVYKSKINDVKFENGYLLDPDESHCFLGQPEELKTLDAIDSSSNNYNNCVILLEDAGAITFKKMFGEYAVCFW